MSMKGSLKNMLRRKFLERPSSGVKESSNEKPNLSDVDVDATLAKVDAFTNDLWLKVERTKELKKV